MQTVALRPQSSSPYARALAASKRARWDLEVDVLYGRVLDRAHKFLPDGLSFVGNLSFLSPAEARLFGQVQGRTYANIFGLVERFINAKVLELSSEHFLGDQVALESLVRFSDEELKHQEMFRRVDLLAERCLPAGYTFLPDPNDVAKVVLGKSTWAVLALTCHIELFTQAHYKESIHDDEALSPLFRDVFKFHWMEESQHAVLDELEWKRADARLSPQAREAAVDDFIALVAAIDGILEGQSTVDAAYFVTCAGRDFSEQERAEIAATMLAAYRYQYIFSGVQRTRFPQILFGMVSADAQARVEAALEGLAG